MSDESNIIPEGRFPARVTEVVLAWTSKREPQIAIGFEFLDQPAVAGKQITSFGSLSKTVISKGKNEGRTVADLTVDDLETCGWDGEGLSTASLATCKGTEVSLVIEHEEDDKGTVRAKVKWINSPNSLGAAVKERLTEADAANLEKSMAGMLMKRKQQRQQKPPQQKRQPPANAGDSWEGPGPDDYDI